MKALKIILKTLKAILTLLVVLILIVVVIQRFSNNRVKVFGYSVYTIISESMKPNYEIGDMIIAQEVEKKDIKIGDDLVYLGNVDSYDGKIITHRVVRIEGNQIITQGTNNPLEDPPIKYDQVYGRVIAKLGLLSAFSKLMNDSILFYVVVFVPFTILIFLDIKDIILEKKEKEETSEDKKEESTEKPVVEETKEEDIEVLEEDNNKE